MATMWRLNERRRRFELVEYDDATGRERRVLEAFVDPSADNSDLRGVPMDAMPSDILAALAPAAQGDDAARQKVGALVGSLIQQSLDQYQQGNTFSLINRQRRAAPGQPGAGTQTGVRLEPEDINAQTNRFLAALDVQGAVNVLNQKEWELRQKMQVEGFDPAEFFAEAGGQQPATAGVPGAAPQNTTAGAYLPAQYVEAYTAQDKAAQTAALQARAQRLQEISNRFTARSAGIKGLKDIGSLRQQIDEMESALNASEAHLSADPGQDKHLVPGADGRWYHGGNAEVALRLRDLKRQYQEAQDTFDPKAAVERKRKEARQQNWNALPQGVRVRQWGDKGWGNEAPDDVDSEQARALAGIYAYTDQDAYLPAYEYGGQNYLPPAPGNAPPTSSPYAPAPPQFPAPPVDGEQMAKLKAAQDEQTGKEALWAERLARAQAQSAQRRQQAQAAFDQEMADIQRERAQLGAMRGMTGLSGAGQPAYAGG